jgi:hypothetical protein
MATTVRRYPEHVYSPRTVTQKVCIGMGILFMIVGFAGVVIPGLFGMHLSFAHNLIHLGSGAIALWAGYSDNSRKAYNFCLSFGSIYLLLGIVGFIFGRPGYPGVGHMEADQNLLRIIPNGLEFGSSDHVVHLLLGGILLVAAFASRKSTTGPRRTRSNLRDASLGRSDINRPVDNARRKEFERRI